MLKQRAHRSLALLASDGLAASSIACGEIQIPDDARALQGDDNTIEMTILPDSPSPQAFLLTLEGGVETTMVVTLDLFDLLFQHGVFTQIVIDNLLFAGTPFTLLGIPTDEVCVVVDDSAPGGGMAFIDIFNGLISFDMSLGTSVLIGSPILAGAIPDGFPFAIDVASTAELSLLDMLGLIFGNTEGGLSLNQQIEDEIIAEIDLGGPAPLMIPIGISANLTLGTANEFPTGTLLDDCYAFLGIP